MWQAYSKSRRTMNHDNTMDITGGIANVVRGILVRLSSQGGQTGRGESVQAGNAMDQHCGNTESVRRTEAVSGMAKEQRPVHTAPVHMAESGPLVERIDQDSGGFDTANPDRETNTQRRIPESAGPHPNDSEPIRPTPGLDRTRPEGKPDAESEVSGVAEDAEPNDLTPCHDCGGLKRPSEECQICAGLYRALVNARRNRKTYAITKSRLPYAD